MSMKAIARWIMTGLPGAIAVELLVTGFTYVPGGDGGKFGAPLPMGNSLSILFGGDMNGPDSVIALVLFVVNVALTSAVLAAVISLTRVTPRAWASVAGAVAGGVVIIGSYVLLSAHALSFAGLPLPFASPDGPLSLVIVWLDAAAFAAAGLVIGRRRRTAVGVANADTS